MISLVLVASFGIILLCCYVISPFLANLVLPKDQQAFGRKTVYIHSYLGSTLHAIVAFSCAMYVLGKGELGKDKVYAYNSAGVISLHITAGYVLADTLIVLRDPYLSSIRSTLLHHAAMIAGIFMCLYYRLYLFFVVYRFVSEFSTPFVNWWSILHELGNR